MQPYLHFKITNASHLLVIMTSLILSDSEIKPHLLGLHTVSDVILMHLRVSIRIG